MKVFGISLFVISLSFSFQSSAEDIDTKFDKIESSLPLYCQMTYKGRATESEEKNCLKLRGKLLGKKENPQDHYLQLKGNFDEASLPLYCRMTYKGRVTESEEKNCLNLRGKLLSKKENPQEQSHLQLKDSFEESSLPLYCQITYKGRVTANEETKCLNLRRKLLSKGEKLSCEEVYETYVICNGNRYELTKTTTSTLLRHIKKIEDEYVPIATPSSSAVQK